MAFRLGKKKKFFEGNYIDVGGTEFFDKAGNLKMWEWIEKRDIVSVLPITAEGRLVLVRNYRVPVEKYVIEAPAGLNDKTGEAIEEVIRRELHEETGYSAKKWIALPPYPFVAGVSRNMIHPFIATELHKTGEAGGEDTEDLTVLEMTHAELMKFALHPPRDTFISPGVFLLYAMAKHLGMVE